MKIKTQTDERGSQTVCVLYWKPWDHKRKMSKVIRGDKEATRSTLVSAQRTQHIENGRKKGKRTSDSKYTRLKKCMGIFLMHSHSQFKNEAWKKNFSGLWRCMRCLAISQSNLDENKWGCDLLRTLMLFSHFCIRFQFPTFRALALNLLFGQN